MAITLAEQHVLATDGVFINRVRQAMATVAVEVLTESPAGMVSGEYSARKSLAQQVVRNANDVARNAAFILVTHPGLTVLDPDAPSDEQYLTVIRNRWNVLSGFNELDPVV